MRILLDTHIVLWVLAGSSRINLIRETILADENDIYVSTASWWELAIKIGVGKFNGKLSEIRNATLNSGFVELPVTGEHTESVLKLPPIHKDPFDRMLIAQAISEPMRIITADGKLESYSELVWKIK